MTPKEVVAAYAEALGNGDVPKAFENFSSEVKWHQPGTHQFAGVKNGPDEIIAMIAKMMELTNGVFSLQGNGDLCENGKFVAMPIHFEASVGERNFDMKAIDLFEVIDGKVINVWLLSDDIDAEDEFWGK